jgi:hypothetical protein
VAALGADSGLEEGPTLTRESGSRAVARAVQAIEDSGTAVMDPVVEVADPLIDAGARGIGVSIAEEPSYEGDTARMFARGPVGPALPFRAAAAEGGRAAVEEPQPPSVPSPPDAPEAYTMELRRPAAHQPALPFASRAAAPSAVEPVAPADSPPSSRWASTRELDPSELPSAHLAEIAAPPRSVALRTSRRTALRPAVVLLLLALFVGALLGLAAMLRW